MQIRRGLFSAFGATVATLMAGSGCQALHNAGVPGLEQYVKVDTSRLEEEGLQREKFSLHHEHAALYWLLANCVENGMQLNEVEHALGEPGEHAMGMGQLKSDGIYQVTDIPYQWGPDSKGYSVILFFRDGRLVNFNAKDYQAHQERPKLPSGLLDY
jgi:hypothetical protein